MIKFNNFLTGIVNVTRRLSIRHKIMGGYAVALGIAVLGTTAGLAIGNYYQQEARIQRERADRQGRLLLELQASMLKVRPAKDFISVVENQLAFERQTEQVFGENYQFQELLQKLEAENDTHPLPNLDRALKISKVAIADNLREFKRVLDRVSPLLSERERFPEAKQYITNFTASSVFQRYIDAAYALTDFVKLSQEKSQAAAIALDRAERLRTEIIVMSMLLSVAIAALLSFGTSLAIARPLEAVTDVVERAIAESNFSLKAPITTRDEIGVLATSFNTLLQKIDQYTQQFLQKNQQLQQTSEQLSQTLNTLQKTQTQLIQTEKMSGLAQIVGGLAHEINNPISFIYSNLASAKTYADELLRLLELYHQELIEPSAELEAELEAIEPEFIREDFPKLLGSMKTGCDRITQIINSLQNFSRFQESELKSVDIHEGLDSTLVVLNHRIHPQIEIIKEYGKLPKIECYPSTLNQVFLQIVTNAIDELNAQTPKNHQWIKIQTEMRDRDRIAIRIIDNGSGIAPEDKDKLFDPFFTKKPIGKGTGLGLSIGYQIVEKHGGTIEVNSQPGNGAEFAIILPVHQHKTSDRQ